MVSPDPRSAAQVEPAGRYCFTLSFRLYRFTEDHTELAVESEVVTPACHQAPQEHGVECGHHEFPGAGIVFAAA